MRGFESGGSWAQPQKNDGIEQRLIDLEWKLWRDLDRLHDELLAKLRSMVKSVGQRTRVDRL